MRVIAFLSLALIKKNQNFLEFSAINGRWIGNNFTLDAKTFEFLASENQYSEHRSNLSFDMDVPLYGNKQPSVSLSNGASNISQTTHTASKMRLSGTLKLNIKDGKIIGSSIEADLVDIKADNFLVQSVQDIIKSINYSFNLNLDPTQLGESP